MTLPPTSIDQQWLGPFSRPKGYRRPTWRALPEGDLLQQGFKSNKVPEDQNISIDVVGFASVRILQFDCWLVSKVDDMSCQSGRSRLVSCSNGNDLPGKNSELFYSQPSNNRKKNFCRIWIILSSAVVWGACGWPLHWQNAVIKSWSWNSSSAAKFC